MLHKSSMANTCRHDYNPQNGIHVIRMPSFLHESLLQKILFAITLQLEKLRNSPIKPVAEFVAGARSVGSANLNIDGGYFSPDVQFKRKEHHLPGLVIEIVEEAKRKRSRKGCRIVHTRLQRKCETDNWYRD